MLFQWVVMVFTIRAVASDKDPQKTRNFFKFSLFVISVLQYSVLLILIALSLYSGIQPPAKVPYPGNLYESILSLFVSLSYTLASIFFFVCGLILYRQFNTSLLVVGENHKAVKRRMIIIVLLVPGSFLFRCILVLIDTFVNLSALWWFDIAYYSIFEFIPLTILVLMSAKSAKPSYDRSGVRLTSE